LSRYAIGIGSNLGDRRLHLADAVAELGNELGELGVSPLYETEPVGGPAQDPYLNAVVVVETDRLALEILDVCQEIEDAHGRVREERWGPRTLDLDIVATDGPPHSDDRLDVPHQRAAEREFVLRPLADIWPEAPIGGGLTAREALSSTGGQGVDFLSDEWLPPVPRWKANALLAGQFALFVAVAVALAYDGTLPGDVSYLVLFGGAMAMVGVVLALLASRSLGRSMTATPIPKPEGELVVAGPYRYARHPIYGGLCLFFMGTALVLDSLLAFLFAAALIPYFLFKARYEERQLRMQYAGYLEYKRTVRRWLIPLVV
jgi:2-amino-4-hydroxy-6-hydroxymethyldihydropteridine diphosphokinase